MFFAWDFVQIFRLTAVTTAPWDHLLIAVQAGERAILQFSQYSNSAIHLHRLKDGMSNRADLNLMFG